MKWFEPPLIVFTRCLDNPSAHLEDEVTTWANTIHHCIPVGRQFLGMFPMSNSKPPFSIRVRKVRAAAGYSQEQLAAELGVSFATVNRWENGHTEPS